MPLPVAREPLPTPPVPNRWWPLDRKVVAGGVGGILAYAILMAVRWRTGLDLNLLVAGILPGVDLQSALALAIGTIVAQVTPPSLKDVLDRINNRMVEIATADPDNPTTAKIVPPHVAAAEADRQIAAGLIPEEIASKVLPKSP